MKVYLAQPMRERKEADIYNVRYAAQKAICEKHQETDCQFINSYYPEWENLNPVEALGKAIEILSGCDIAYFAPDWDESNGCSVEWNVCEMYDIPHAEIYIPNYLELSGNPTKVLYDYEGNLVE